MKSFVDKYKPKNSSEIPQNLEELRKIIKNKTPQTAEFFHQKF